MKIDIGLRKIETDDVNVITVEANYYPSTNVFADGCIVIHKNDRNDIRNFGGLGRSIGQLQDAVRAIGSLIDENGVKGFVMLRDRFLINIENIKTVQLKSTYDGLYLVEAEFENGQVVEIYRGQREKFAVKLIKEYQRAERDYFNSVEQTK